MMKYRGDKLGSARCSRLRLTCKNNSNNSKSSPNISNYFVKTKQPAAEEIVDLQSSTVSEACDELEEVSNTESPYQNFLTEIQPLLNDSLSDKSDFKSVEPLKCSARRKAGATTTAKLLSVKAGKAKKTRQITMVRLMERNFSNGDVNGDHLQMALALSRSMQDLENSSPKEKGEEEDLSAVQRPVRRGNTILEQFGFNTGRKLGAENKIGTSDAFKKRKKSRYQYITPVLFLRTDEDREKIIATKVSLILSQKNKFEVDVPQQQAISLTSSYLQDLNKGEVYRLNQLTHEELKNKKLFYLNNLKVPQSMCASGYLLKDWNGIFGREATPPRDVKVSVHQQLESNVPKGERTPPAGFKTSNHQQLESPRGVQSSLKKDFFTSHVFGREATPPRDVKISVHQQLESDVPKGERTPPGGFKTSTHQQLESPRGVQSSLKKDFFTSHVFGREATPPRDVVISDHQQLESNKENVPKNESTPPRDFKTPNHQQLKSNATSPRGVQSSFKKNFTTSHHQSDETKSRESCMSPDLFDSDDDLVVNDLNRSINEQLELSQRLINDFKSKSIFFNRSSSNDPDDDCKEKPATRSNFDSPESNVAECFEYENRNGIYHFESFQESTDYCMIKKDAADLGGILNGCEKPMQSNQEIVRKEFYDLTVDSSDDDENFVSYIPMVNSGNKSRSFEGPSSLLGTVESVSQNSSLEKVLASDKSDCELEISSTICDESPITFIHSSNSNQSESQKKLTQETATKEGQFKKSNSSDLVGLSHCIGNEKTCSFPSDVNSGHNYTFVSESDEHLSQQSDEELPPADCGSKNNLGFEKFNSFSSASDGNLSQEGFSDEELNYSSMYTKSIINLEDSTSEEEEDGPNNKFGTLKSPIQNAFKDDIDANTQISVLTPENKFNKHLDKLIIKTKGITPLPNYTEMDTPRIAKELQKFGIKKLKRRRGVEILQYIYDSTHPLIPEQELGSFSDDGGHPVKRRKKDDMKKSRRKLESRYKEENKIWVSNEQQRVELVGDLLLKENENDLIFEKRQSTRVASCRVPLHIAWFNLVASHPEIRESILLYEPLQLEVLYSLLKEQSYKYSIQDLLTFLDKKCITIRTNQNQRKTAQNRIKVNKST